MSGGSSFETEIDLRDWPDPVACPTCRERVTVLVIRRHATATMTVLVPCGHSATVTPVRDADEVVRWLIREHARSVIDIGTELD